MAEFRIKVEGLTKLAEALDKNSALEKALLPEFGKAVQNFHRALEEEVIVQYNTRKKLSSVMRGGLSIRTAKSIGRKVLEQEIVYEGERIPLSQFVTSITESSNTGRFRTPQAGVSITKKGLVKRRKPNKVYQVSVKRGVQKPAMSPRGKPAFMLENFPKKLAGRMTDKTWVTEPEIRAPYWQLEALSLPEMAGNVFNNAAIQRAADVFHKRVADTLDKALAGI